MTSSFLTMQQTLTLRDWLPTTTATNPTPPISSAAAVATSNSELHVGSSSITSEDLKKLISENPIVVLARRGCCMCHVIKLLLHGHGVNPTILDVDDNNEGVVTDELKRISAVKPQLPAVFVGGEFFGRVEDVVGAHITGELVPRLRKAKALWL